MTAKLKDGNIIFPVWVLCSDDQPIQACLGSFAELHAKHLQHREVVDRPPPDQSHCAFQANEQDIARTVACAHIQLTSKCLNAFALNQISNYLSLLQLGVSIPDGCEATVHATQRLLTSLSDNNKGNNDNNTNINNCHHYYHLILFPRYVCL